MSRGLLIAVATLLAACSVDSGGFSGVMTEGGSASASSPSAATQSSEDTTEGSGTTDAGDMTASGTQSSGSASVDTTASADTTASDDAGATSTSTGGAESETGSETGAGACGGAPLNAQLAVPPLCAPTCTSIGSGADCAGITICRLKDTQTAVCESCAPCGNLHALCTQTSECDILFTCFMGQCTAMCDFDTPQTCGNPAACTDVGHPTHGVCDPTL